MNRYSMRVLKQLSYVRSSGELEDWIIDKGRSSSIFASCIHDLKEKGYVMHVDTLYDVTDNRKPVPGDHWCISPKGLTYLQEEKAAAFWRSVPLLVSSLLSLAAIIISIIALQKP